MDTSNRYAADFPALTGDVVMQGHADYCNEHGHATHETAPHEGHEGPATMSPYCPRCGEDTRGVPVPPRYAAEQPVHEGESGRYRVAYPDGGMSSAMGLADIRAMAPAHWREDAGRRVVDARTGEDVDRINEQPTRVVERPAAGDWVAVGTGPSDWSAVIRTADEHGRIVVDRHFSAASGYAAELDRPDGGWHVLDI